MTGEVVTSIHESVLGPTRGVQVRVLRHMEDLPGEAATWNSLVKESAYPNVFRRWEWVSTWESWFGRRSSLRILEVRHDSRIVGIVPWYVDETGYGPWRRARILRFVGTGGPTFPEYLGPIVHRDFAEAVIEGIVDYLHATIRHWDVVEFPDVPADDAATNRLVERCSATWAAIAWPGVVCPTVDLPDTYDELLRRTSGRRRNHLGRKVRRAERECHARLVRVGPESFDAALFNELKRLSASSRSRLGHASPFVNELYAGFHREVIAKLMSEGVAVIHLLLFHEAPVAFLYGFLMHDRYCFFQTGFDVDWARYSPGNVVMQKVLEELIRSGVKEFDYLRGEEAYKAVFATAARRTQSTMVCARRGTPYLSYWLRVHIARRLIAVARRVLPRSENVDV